MGRKESEPACVINARRFYSASHFRLTPAHLVLGAVRPARLYILPALQMHFGCLNYPPYITVAWSGQSN